MRVRVEERSSFSPKEPLPRHQSRCGCLALDECLDLLGLKVEVWMGLLGVQLDVLHELFLRLRRERARAVDPGIGALDRVGHFVFLPVGDSCDPPTGTSRRQPTVLRGPTRDGVSCRGSAKTATAAQLRHESSSVSIAGWSGHPRARRAGRQSAFGSPVSPRAKPGEGDSAAGAGAHPRLSSYGATCTWTCAPAAGLIE